MKNKVCTICKNLQSLDNFYKNKGSKGGYHSQCKICFNKKNKYNSIPCLYQVKENNKIVYIGITKDFNKRIIGHKSKLKSFNTFNKSQYNTIIEDINVFKWEKLEENINYNLLKIKELELLVKYKPKYNSPYREYYENLAT